MEYSGSNCIAIYLEELAKRYELNCVGVFKPNGQMVAGGPENSDMNILTQIVVAYSLSKGQIGKLGLGHVRTILLEKKDSYLLLADDSSFLFVIDANSDVSSIKGQLKQEISVISQALRE